MTRISSARRAGLSDRNLSDSGKKNIASRPTRIGAMPPVQNMTCHP